MARVKEKDHRFLTFLFSSVALLPEFVKQLLDVFKAEIKAVSDVLLLDLESLKPVLEDLKVLLSDLSDIWQLFLLKFVVDFGVVCVLNAVPKRTSRREYRCLFNHSEMFVKQ